MAIFCLIKKFRKGVVYSKRTLKLNESFGSHMLNLKYFVLIISAIVFVNAAFAENPIRKKRVKSARPDYLKFGEISNAFNAGNHDKAKALIDSLELDLDIVATKKGKLHQFDTYLSLGYLAEAKKLARELVDDNGFNYLERAGIHNALGNAYLATDDLDGAVNEFKKILELYEKNQ